MIEGLEHGMVLLEGQPNLMPALDGGARHGSGALEAAVNSRASGGNPHGITFVPPGQIERWFHRDEPLTIQQIIVTGHRSGGGYGGGGYGGGDGWNTYTEEDGGGDTIAPTPPDLNCLTEAELNQLGPEEREAYEVAVVAAKIAREIMAMPDKDKLEYGALIYRDTNGVITHTPLTKGGPVGVTPVTTGLPDYGHMLAFIHSHTADTYTSTGIKAYPTPNNGAGGEGDWFVFDWFVSEARKALIAGGLTEEQANEKVLRMHQFMLGPTAVSGTNLYDLRKYTFDDRDILTLGQKVDMRLGLCST